MHLFHIINGTDGSYADKVEDLRGLTAVLATQRLMDFTSLSCIAECIAAEYHNLYIRTLISYSKCLHCKSCQLLLLGYCYLAVTVRSVIDSIQYLIL